MNNLVVARFADGRLVKGTSLDVHQNRPTCHVRTAEGEMLNVKLDDLKALFFVRSLSGDSAHVEGAEIAPVDPRLRGSRLVEVTFEDGETLTGLSNSFPPTTPFFFITPVDTASNNLRILINRGRVTAMQQLTTPPAT